MEFFLIKVAGLDPSKKGLIAGIFEKSLRNFSEHFRVNASVVQNILC